MRTFIIIITVRAVVVIYRVNFIVSAIKNVFVAENFLKKKLQLNTIFLNIS